MIERIRDLVKSRKYRLTLHARTEMFADEVSTDDLLIALEGGYIIEDYPEDLRGHSHLVLGFFKNHAPLHVCCAIHEEELVIITVYRPEDTIWMPDWSTRR